MRRQDLHDVLFLGGVFLVGALIGAITIGGLPN